MSRQILASFPAWTIFAAPHGIESLPNLYRHHDEIAVRIRGQYRPCRVWTTVGSEARYGLAPAEAVKQADGLDEKFNRPRGLRAGVQVQASVLSAARRAHREFPGHEFGHIIGIHDEYHGARYFRLIPAANDNVRLEPVDPAEFAWGERA